MKNSLLRLKRSLGSGRHRVLWRLGRCMLAAVSVLGASSTAVAQLAPLGGHYQTGASSTGFEGVSNSQGAYSASVPLDLPSARGGLPIPVRVSYTGREVGAAGLGWDVPLSFI